jgi:hypothetical protein
MKIGDVQMDRYNKVIDGLEFSSLAGSYSSEFILFSIKLINIISLGYLKKYINKVKQK